MIFRSNSSTSQHSLALAEAYLKDTLPKLGQWSMNRVAELTPTAWKASKKY